MLRNELLIFFPQKEFFSDKVLKGYAELRLPFPMKIYGVKLEYSGKEFFDFQGKKDCNAFWKGEVELPGTGSKPGTKDIFGFKKKVATVVPKGNHKYHFSIQIPSIVPPSFSCPYAKIEYELKITVLSAIKGTSNLVSTAKIPIGGSIFDMNFLGNNSVPLQIKDSKTFFFTKGSLDVSVDLESKVFLSGDPIRIHFDFMNGTSKSVSNMKCKLVQKIDCLYYGKKCKTEEYTLAQLSLGSLDGKQQKHPNAELQIPTTVPESIEYKILKNSKIGKNVQILYGIHLTGEISMGNDLKMFIPITIVRRSRHQNFLKPQNQQQHQHQQHQQPPQQQYGPPPSQYNQPPPSQYNQPPPQHFSNQPHPQQNQYSQFNHPPPQQQHFNPPPQKSFVPPPQQQPPQQQQQQQPQPIPQSKTSSYGSNEFQEKYNFNDPKNPEGAPIQGVSNPKFQEEENISTSHYPSLNDPSLGESFNPNIPQKKVVPPPPPAQAYIRSLEKKKMEQDSGKPIYDEFFE